MNFSHIIYLLDFPFQWIAHLYSFSISQFISLGKINQDTNCNSELKSLWIVVLIFSNCHLWGYANLPFHVSLYSLSNKTFSSLLTWQDKMNILFLIYFRRLFFFPLNFIYAMFCQADVLSLFVSVYYIIFHYICQDA